MDPATTQTAGEPSPPADTTEQPAVATTAAAPVEVAPEATAPATTEQPAVAPATTGSDDYAASDDDDSAVAIQSVACELRSLPLALLFDAGQIDPTGPRRLVNIGEGNISHVEQYPGAASNLLYLRAYSGQAQPIPISDDKLAELLAICPMVEGDC